MSLSGFIQIRRRSATTISSSSTSSPYTIYTRREAPSSPGSRESRWRCVYKDRYPHMQIASAFINIDGGIISAHISDHAISVTYPMYTKNARLFLLPGCTGAATSPSSRTCPLPPRQHDRGSGGHHRSSLDRAYIADEGMARRRPGSQTWQGAEVRVGRLR